MYKEAFLKKMKEDLLLQRKELLSKAVSQDADVDTDGDEFDEIQGNILKELQNQLCNRDNNKLILIENALSRINHGTYGVCEDCEELIPVKRLQINPYVSICVDCAEDREILEKQRKRSIY